MAISTIRIKRGSTATPTLAIGELGFNTGTNIVSIGTSTGNRALAGHGLGTVKTDYNTANASGANNLARYLLNGHTVLNATTQSALDFRASRTADNEQLGNGSLTLGTSTRAFGEYSISGGAGGACNGYASIGYGQNAVVGAGATTSYLFGSQSVIAPNAAYAFGAGGNITINAIGSHAIGTNLTVNGSYASAHNRYVTAPTYAINSFGQYNTDPAGSASTFSTTNSAMVIGNGAAANTKGNCFRVRFDGNVYGLAAFNASGADYSEFFEWSDGNTKAEDRIGYFVSLATNSDKVEKCKNGTKFCDILGVVSNTGSIRGNAYSESWKNMYQKDAFGRVVYDVRLDEKGVEVKIPRINPNYDPSLEYESREDRKEWDPIGLLGKVYVRDDGSCKVGGLCTTGNGGIGTSAKKDEGFKVLARITPSVIEILLK